jgi:hypothetical protein
MKNLTDAEVEWWSDRVRHYIRRSFSTVRAMDRAFTDLKWHRVERAIDRAFGV